MDPDAPIKLPDVLAQDPGADLLSTYWPTVIFAALAAALVVLAVWVARRRRKRLGAGRTWWGRSLISVAWAVPIAAVLTVSLALGVNTWVGYFPSFPTFQRWVDDKTRPPVVHKPKTAVTGEQQSDTLPGADPHHRVTTETRGFAFAARVPAKAKGTEYSGAWVYLPPDYDREGNTQRYPVIYALHGAPGSAADWFAGGRLDYVVDQLISSGAMPPAIVISPDLNTGANRLDEEPLNYPKGPQIEDFVTKDVVPWADSNLRTEADAQHRVISGMSAGGLGALVYGLHHPEVYGGVISLLPYSKIYTPAIKNDPKALRENSPLQIIADRGSSTKQPIFLGQGDGESTKEATEIRDALRAQGQTTTLRVLPGLGHTWEAARTLMPLGLVWTSQQLGWK